MSSREPMWYCHECNAEMRPLMVPDPHCASCNGTFVEKMENPADDPREFHNFHGHGGDGDDAFGPLEFIASLQDLLRPETPGPTRTGRNQSPNSNRHNTPRGSMGLRFESSGTGGRRTFIIGGNNTLSPGRSEVNSNTSPRMSEDEADGNIPHDRRIPGPLMAQYLLSLLANGPRGSGPGLSGHPLFGHLGGAFFGGQDDIPSNGRMGDYVFTQEALDQIITQIMDGANANRPVPATEEIMDNLPRDVLLEDSPLLEKDCAVCKEQFNAHDEEPDNQVVVTLPCKHPFHEGCIMPWLKSSGTCPVCRHALVPQPQSHPSRSPTATPDAGGNHSPRPPRSPSGSNGSPPVSPTLSDFFSNYLSPNGPNVNSTGSNSRTRSNSDPRSNARFGGSQNTSRSDHIGDPHFPGEWGDVLD